MHCGTDEGQNAETYVHTRKIKRVSSSPAAEGRAEAAPRQP